MFRSETMQYYDIIFSKDNAWEILDNLGQIGVVDFEDTHPHLMENQKPYFSQKQDIKEALLNLSEIERSLVQWNLLKQSIEFDENRTQESLKFLRYKIKSNSLYDYSYQVMSLVLKEHKQLQNQIQGYKVMEEKIQQSNDYLNVLRALKRGLPSSFTKTDAKNNIVSLTAIVGVIPNENLYKFQRTLFRIGRGNIFATYTPVTRVQNSFYEQQNIHKTIVLLTFQDSNKHFLTQQVKKLCENFSMFLYPIPSTYEELRDEEIKALSDNYEANNILESTYYEIEETLIDFKVEISQDITTIYYYKSILLALYNYYTVLNKIQLGPSFYQGRFWLPAKKQSYFNQSIIKLEQHDFFAGVRINQLDPSTFNLTPPTYFDLPSFYQPFQEIIDTYGIPRYKEANPGLFAIVWFPYMFGTMFGDIGHGIALFIITIFIYLKSALLPESITNVKSLLLIMSCFAIYCGLVYNDFLSIPIPFFSSCFQKQGDEFQDQKCVYPFGFDYVWFQADNQITFVNSFKMKISIMIGVVHMIIGITLKGLNALHFKEYLSFLFEFLPQIIFFLSTFGYMCLLIALKWLNNYEGIENKAPSIISLYINFVQSVDYPIYSTAETQLYVQQILAMVAVVCVPIMFLCKPLFALCIQKSHQNDSQEEETRELLTHQEREEQKQQQEEHSFGEDIVHQAIETIEFVLGSVSNTASYLRLWALSLAHSQLAEVFLDMLVRPYFMGSGDIGKQAIFLVLSFVIFFFVTVGVLLIMSMMECLLHALRLQWVEFQNKFYKGDGIKFLKFDQNYFIKENFYLFTSNQ